ncbi:MAG: Fic family protein [Chloroflexi bacterium]|nr:Fic family protein [Chloroflexota bacterium]
MTARRAWPDIIFADRATRANLAKAAKTGSIVRLTTGIYSGLRLSDPGRVAREHWREILAHELPGAVLVDRSARRTMPDDQGRVFVAHPRSRPLVMPGLSILPRRGPTQVDGDIDIGDGLRQSSIARGLLDNLAGDGQRYFDLAEVERWITDILDDHGADRLNAIRDEARGLAPVIGRRGAMKRLDRIIAAALSTGPDAVLATPALRSRASGDPIDPARIERFERLAAYLRDQAPDILLDEPDLTGRRTLLPFYEAYFSNYIEGTEFTLDEAADIALAGRIPVDRPADAHDVAGTYRLTSDRAEMSRVPADADQLLALLRSRHRVVMEGRPDQRPGEWKALANRAGTTHFVAPDRVIGTLRAGFEVGSSVLAPLARAVFLMFLVSEVHPFADGNGRVARLMMNAELVSAAEVRIIIPTIYRNDVLAALRGATHNAVFEALYAAIGFARRYTARVDFTDRMTAERDLERTNALMDANLAETNGVRLLLP